jgi:photosystem II stability/assembly factor-like uncharacterized protein
MMVRLTIFLLATALSSHGQYVKLLNSGTLSSLRGLSVVTDKVIWVSGNNGTVGRSVDGGNNWKWFTITGFEKTDFRDIEAFDRSTAIIMGISSPAYILKTIDGGETWKLVFENKDTAMFLDAMDFYDQRNGMVIGDPVNHKIFLAKTTDAGNTWHDIGDRSLLAQPGEACFASSGTNIRMTGKGEFLLITGGLRSRLLSKTKSKDLPILQGKESAGANSIAVKDKKTFIVVGGDFNTPDSTKKVCFISKDAGKTWITPVENPHGYRSCVEFLRGSKWISCGTNGVDHSIDDGKTWKQISSEGFNVCRKAKHGRSVFMAGSKGRIGKLSF